MEFLVAALIAPAFRFLVIAPILWLLERVIPEGRGKATLFQEWNAEPRERP